MSPPSNAVDAEGGNAKDDTSEKRHNSVPTRRNDDDDAKPYILSNELGKGSFATVYKGYHEDNHMAVAIKAVSRSILKPKLLESLQSEIRIMKQLSHKHITKLIDIKHAERNIYLIMEYCSGGDLTNYIKKRGKVETLEYVPAPGSPPIYYPHPRTGGLDEIVVRSFLRQLARALKFLREQNLIHRDIKPQNLLLKPASPQELARGHPLGVPILKVADFGFAKSLPDAMMAETLCGSPLYMAPEILRYEKYDAKVDLWSVGAVLYEMTVGKPPFRANNPMELLKRIESTQVVKFPDEDPANFQKNPELKAVPMDIKDLIRALLKRKPIERATFDKFFGSTAMKNSKDVRSRTAANGGQPNGTSSPTTSGRDADTETVVLGTIGRGSRTASAALANIPLAMKEHERPAPSPPVAVQANANPPIVPPKVIFRRATGSEGPSMGFAEDFNGGQPGDHVAQDETTGTRSPYDSDGLTKPLSPDGSFTHEEDGSLRREYVLVGDTKAIKLHQDVDELKSTRRAPLRERKSHQHSPTVENRPGGNFRFGENDAVNTGIRTNSTDGKDEVVNTTFPPPPHPYAPPLSSSPRSSASALTRALSIASKKLFGTPSNTRSTPPYTPEREQSRSPKRAPPSFSGRTPSAPMAPVDPSPEGTERDPLEDDLLCELEMLAQKADVLTRWADEMFEYVKQKPIAQTPKLAKREIDSDRTAEARRMQDAEAEYNAVTCVALYVLLMSFSQKGIDKLRVHHEGLEMRDPGRKRFFVTEGFDHALTWFKEHFLKCNDRAALVKAWLPENSTVEDIWLDQVVYDHALLLSRKAARLELLDPNAKECEQLYEESLWCLYALEDEVMQRNNPYHNEDRKTITTWIEKTKKRLNSCRSKRVAHEGANGDYTSNGNRVSSDATPVPPSPVVESPATVGRRASPRH